MSNGTTDRPPRSQPEREKSAPNSPPLVSRLTARQHELWRTALFVLVVLGAALAAVAWPETPDSPLGLHVLPIGLVVLVCLFAVYAWFKTKEMAQLQGLVRGLEQRASTPPDVEQLEKLFGMVQRSQRGYRDLIDTFDDLLFSLSLDGHIVAANRSFADLVGQSFADLVGRPLDELFDLAGGGGRAAAEKALARFLERRHWSGVLRVELKRDASSRFFQCDLHVLVRDGQDHGVCVLARDITQDRENEARFTELFETLQEGVYLATADGHFENVNPALARMLGYEKREEMLDRPLSDFLFQPAQWEAAQRELALSGTIRGHEVTLRRRNGSTLTCLHAAALIRDTAGHVRRHQGTLVDITERREMELRLHREQEFARRLVESFPDLVIALDREGRYTFVSPRSKELLGFPPEEMVGKLLGERMEPRDRKEVRAFFDAVLSGQRTNGNIEYFTRHADGSTRLFRASASPLYAASGQVEGIIASARDITEAKRMEQQLIQTERLAAMGQMIAGVAHELNNPLTAVLGVTELLRDSASDDVSRRQLELAHRQARRAAQIVQNLLSFSRPPQPHKACVHLGDLIQRSLQLHEHSLRTNGITVDFVPKADLPAVMGDASQLSQVFLNLITNAEQAIHEIRQHGTLRIRVGALGERVLVTFQDDGVGIHREILPKIFDPFFTTKRPGRGTGLGLSICLAILREHNGQIEAQPLADGGTVFTVSLPVAKGTEMFLAEPVAVARSSSASSGVMDRLAGRSVLVVDDEEGIRELVRDGLTARGARVDLAASGEEALCLLESRDYEIVLCDVNLRRSLPNALSGLELYSRLAEGLSVAPNGQKPLFLFMTGELAEKTTAESLAGTAVRTLQKPFRISDLVAALTEALVGAPQSAPSSLADQP
jgi:PAS domain S-box-containing protein